MKDAVLLLLCAIALANGLNQDLKSSRCNCNPTEAEKICEENFDKDNVLIAHNNCDKFYLCSNGQPVAHRCPNNLLYDPYREICDWPQNVECGDRPISDGCDADDSDCNNGSNDEDNDNNDEGICNCDPAEAPYICAAEGSNGIFVAHEICNKYYICSNNVPVGNRCPSGLLYNPYRERCDWPQNVDCGDREIVESDNESDNNDNTTEENDGPSNCNPEEAPAICAEPGSNGVFVAHENCEKYYICSNGIPVASTCPANLLYNTFTRRCDWPRNVDCGDRIEPECICDSDENCGDNNNEAADSESEEDIDLPPAGDDEENDNGTGDNEADENDNDNDDNGTEDSGTDDNGANDNGTEDNGNNDNEADDNNDNGADENNDNDNNDNDNNDNGNDGTCNCNPEEAPAICAEEGSDGTLVAHQYCNKFYKCYNGEPVSMVCPVNLLYNPHLEICDWPENVDCGEREIPEPDNDNNENEIDSDSNENGNDNDDDNNDDSEEDDLPPGGDDESNDSGNVDNDNESNDNGNVDNDNDNNEVTTENNGNDDECPDECNCDPNDARWICAAPDSDGIFVAHEYCNHFYQCSDGKPVAIRCPSNLLYNIATEQCDWPFNVKCGDRVIPDEDENENDNNEEVDSSENERPCNCNPEEAPVICAQADSDGVLIAHEICNNFYQCVNGKPESRRCPRNLLYNPYRERCDWSDNVDCGDRIISEQEESEENSDNDNETDNINVNEDPSQAPAICAASGSDGELVAHEYCNKFYICSGGLPDVQTCPGQLLYNPFIARCDWPRNVDCGDRVDPNPIVCPCEPRNAPVLCSRPNSDGQLIAHENCDQFYKCAEGIPVALSCPSSLLYNIEKEYCDWPQNVNCENRIILQVSMNKHLESRQTLRK